MNEEIIKAVHDDDIDELLTSLEVYESFSRGEVTCAFCNEVMTKDNLSSIFPLENKVAFCCDKPECIAKLFEKEE